MTADESLERMRAARLRAAHVAVADVLAELAADLFAPGMRLTLVARMPGDPECELLVTDDEDLAAVRDAVERRLAEPEGRKL